ncbi:MAG: polyprenyl synthetase family protein [Candidatus Altiarchaeota archaeon]
MDIKSVLKEKASLVEPVMRGYLEVADPEIRKMLLHTFEAGGKRVRPALVLLSAECVGCDSNKLLSAAAAVELLHTFTLVHDDIMDKDLGRRGRPTVHALWGEEIGIVVGDTLYSASFQALVDSRKAVGDCTPVLDALEVLTSANSELQEGQIHDVFFEDRVDVNVDEYLDMVKKKTGVLMEASTKIGAILGGGTKEQVEALGDYGRNVGIAFQIQDDILDMVADQEKLGKRVGSDLREGKRSIIILHALANASDQQKEKIHSVLGLGDDATEEQVHEVVKLFKEINSIEYARDLAKDLGEKAKKSLGPIEDGQAKEALCSLADFIINREF